MKSSQQAGPLLNVNANSHIIPSQSETNAEDKKKKKRAVREFWENGKQNTNLEVLGGRRRAGRPAHVEADHGVGLGLKVPV